MTLVEYKKKVEKCLVKKQHCTTDRAKQLMKHYEQDFQEFLKTKLTPEEVAIGMFMNLL